MAALLSGHGALLAVLLMAMGASASDLGDYDMPTRAPGEVPTLLEDHHSREVAACRRRGNLYAFYEPLSRCMPLMETGGSPCPDKEVLVLNATSLEAQCMKLPCDVTHVLLPDGRCHTKEEFCDHAEDKELVLKETGYGTCDCPDLHVYWMEDDRCYAAYTRGPCGEGEYIVFREEVGVVCEDNPCPEEQVPWRGQCVPRTGHGCLDSKHGHLVLNPANLKYECTLRCPEGMVEVDLDCYDLYTRGPCPAGEYVVHVPGSQLGRCEENPCGEDGLVPWDDKCWQRGQYCATDLPPPPSTSSIGAASEKRRPQKREPVRLPDDDHLVILDRNDLLSTGPADGWVDSGPASQFSLFGSSAPSGFSEMSGPSGPSGPSGSSAPSGPSGPSMSQILERPPEGYQYGPETPKQPDMPKHMLPPPPQVPPGPAPPMRLGGSSDNSHLIDLPSPHFGPSLAQIAAFNSILPPPSQFEQSYGQNGPEPSPVPVSQSHEQTPPRPSFLPAPPHLSQSGGERMPPGHSVLPPPPQFTQQETFPSPPRPVPANTPTAPSSGQPSAERVPSLAHGYLPPPPSSGSLLAKRHTETGSLPQLQLSFPALRPFGSPADGPVRGRVRRSARLDKNDRFTELLQNNGFVSIDDDHPFNGNFDTLSAVQGLHINVNPLTYEVECSDAIGYYRTISFAHYKCRPGSRRDLLGECHHEGPDWTDYHPDRCPFGRRHNLLTGKCMRIS
ncbi:mucin-2-like [Amphibalanus amphitrite]|uniref:mucin-2-like n=1 Tax=Amphibalanus amphitrite TaxID=1232801 RepID=UPI001C90C7DF|nr:mucin-2-like [Amphibalanus amphitrite]